MWNEERAQVSAELIIIIAAVLAVALVMVNQLQATAESSAKVLQNNSDSVLERIKQIGS